MAARVSTLVLLAIHSLTHLQLVCARAKFHFDDSYAASANAAGSETSLEDFQKKYSALHKRAEKRMYFL